MLSLRGKKTEYLSEINFHLSVGKAVYCNVATYRPMIDLIISKTLFFLSFRRVVNVIYSFLGNSPASEI